MYDPFKIKSFDHFIAREFDNFLVFPIACRMEEYALNNCGADHTFLQRIFKEFFTMPVNTPADAVRAAIKAAQLNGAGFDQALKAFTAFFYGLYEPERLQFYAALDNYAAGLNVKDPCDWIDLDYMHELRDYFPGDNTHCKKVTVSRSYDNNPPETVLVGLGAYGDLIWDCNSQFDMSFQDQVLYCVLNMWLHPQSRRDYACIGGDPDDEPNTDLGKYPDLKAELDALKKASTARYNLELKAARQ